MQTVIDLYTGGLGQPLAHDVELQHPANLQPAMSLARAYEQRHLEASAVNSSSASKPSVRRASATTSTGGPAPDGKAEGSRPRFRRLTAAEMQEKRQNGQCYFCPEPFSKEHKCAARGGVFLMDLGDDELDPLRDITDLEISLHALTGLNSADSMLLQVTVGGV